MGLDDSPLARGAGASSLGDAKRAHAYDIVHINAVAPRWHDFLVSLRHTDAIYSIARATGDVVWKLPSGTRRARTSRSRRQRALSSGASTMCARCPTAAVTPYPSGTDRGRPPRVLRFRIDSRVRTATLLEHISDPRVDLLMGAAAARRKLPGRRLGHPWGAEPFDHRSHTGG